MALAASRDTSRPMLQAVHVLEDSRTIVATDGMRLHIARLAEPGAYRPGTWHFKTREPIEGTYLKWEQVVSEEGRACTIDLDETDIMARLSGLDATDRASRRSGARGFRYAACYGGDSPPQGDVQAKRRPPTKHDDRGHVVATYLLDALKGMPFRLVNVLIRHSRAPIRLDAAVTEVGCGRTAVVMPFLRTGATVDVLDLDPFLKAA